MTLLSKSANLTRIFIASFLCLACLQPMMSLAFQNNSSIIKKFYDLNDPEFLIVKQKASKGDAKAQFQVGETYNNENSQQIRAEALHWFEKSGKQGFAEALFAEGHLYYEQYYFRDDHLHYPKLENKQLLALHMRLRKKPHWAC